MGVSGRAGRSESRGKVVIQTKNINHYVNRRIIENDDINFYKNQIIQRKEFNYPLVSRINNFYIINILLKLDPKYNIPNQKKLIKKLLSKFSNYPEFRSVKVLIDVDPYN